MLQLTRIPSSVVKKLSEQGQAPPRWAWARGMGTERKEDEHRSRTQTEEMAEWVRAHTIKSEPPGPTCWKESLAVHVAKCPPPSRTVPGRGGGEGTKREDTWALGRFFSILFQLTALGHVRTQHSTLCLVINSLYGCSYQSRWVEHIYSHTY